MSLTPSEVAVKPHLEKITDTSEPVIENILVKNDREFLEKLAHEHPIDNINKQDKIEVVLNKSFKRMHAMSSYFNGQSLQRKELQELLQDPEKLDMAKSILLNFELTKVNFAEDQALARVYAIKMLAETTREGDSSVVYEVTTQLAEQLDQQVQQGLTIQQGREYDLDSLLDIAINQAEINELTDPNNIEYLLFELGYKDDMSTELVQRYDNAVFFPLLKIHGREKASEMVAQVITNN
ncbi:hypothetical protein [Pseudoalteromonas denitrificans]|nr:hypothetical protein [Pseudoalteromonas denitrificans]